MPVLLRVAWLPRNLRDLQFLGHSAAEGEQVIRQPIQVNNGQRFDFFDLVKGDYQSLGTAANCAGHMSKRNRWVATWKDKESHGWQGLREQIDLVLQKRNVGTEQRRQFHAGVSRLGGENTAKGEQAVLNFNEHFLAQLIDILIAQQTYVGIEFIYCAVSINAQFGFQYTLTAKQRSCSGVARFRVNFHMQWIVGITQS